MANHIPDYRIPVGDWVESGVDWIQDNFTGALDGVSDGLGLVIGSFEDALMAIPPLLLAALIVALAWWRVGWRFGLFAVAALALIFGMDIWKETLATLALVIGSSLVALAIGIPIGIAMARSDTVEAIVRPIRDHQDRLDRVVRRRIRHQTGQTHSRGAHGLQGGAAVDGYRSAIPGARYRQHRHHAHVLAAKHP